MLQVQPVEPDRVQRRRERDDDADAARVAAVPAEKCGEQIQRAREAVRDQRHRANLRMPAATFSASFTSSKTRYAGSPNSTKCTASSEVSPAK